MEASKVKILIAHKNQKKMNQLDDILSQNNYETLITDNKKDAISDNYIIIGSRYYNSRGAAFIYKNSNDSWSQTAMITANPSVNSTYFASDLAITDTHAFVGCSKDAVYVYERSNESWSQIDVLKPKQTGEYFGRYLAFDGNKLAIASDSYNTVHSEKSGKITLFKFENNSFTQISTLYPHAAYDAAQGFGSILYFSGNMLIMGAGYHNSWKDFDEAY
ncbi:PKD domain-containing protein, partial [Candidatus Magnetomorum sp. HK-1]